MTLSKQEIMEMLDEMLQESNDEEERRLINELLHEVKDDKEFTRTFIGYASKLYDFIMLKFLKLFK